MQIAGDLDALERNFMAEGGVDSSDYLKFMAEESGNAAMDGNFSIQVSRSDSLTTPSTPLLPSLFPLPQSPIFPSVIPLPPIITD